MNWILKNIIVVKAIQKFAPVRAVTRAVSIPYRSAVSSAIDVKTVTVTVTNTQVNPNFHLIKWTCWELQSIN